MMSNIISTSTAALLRTEVEGVTAAANAAAVVAAAMEHDVPDFDELLLLLPPHATPNAVTL